MINTIHDISSALEGGTKTFYTTGREGPYSRTWDKKAITLCTAASHQERLWENKFCYPIQSNGEHTLWTPPVADFLRALHWPSLTLPPPASQLDNSEEKTCFVPVYFSGSKSWSIGRVLRCWCPNSSSATDWFLHNIDKASTIGSQPTFTFCLRNTKMANHAKIMQHHPPPHLLKFFFNWKPFPFWFFAFMLLVVLLVMWWCTKCGDAPNVEMPQMWRCTKCGDGFHVFKIFPWFS